MKVNKNTTIGEVLRMKEGIESVLSGFGLHCFGCPMSQMETLEEAAEAHELDLNVMIAEINKALNKK